MKALIIKDLSVAVELDGKSMAAVHGGHGGHGRFGHGIGSPSVDFKWDETKFEANQQLMQSQNTETLVGVNAAFLNNVGATVTPTQTGNNNISFR